MKKRFLIGALAITSIFSFAQTEEGSDGDTSSSERKFWGTTTGCTESQVGGVRCCTTIRYILWMEVSQESTCYNL